MDLVFQGTTSEIDFALVDHNGAAVPKANLSTLTAKLYDLASGSVINGRDYQNIIDANGGVVNADGTGTLSLGTSDNPIVNPAIRVGDTEEHGLAVRFTTSGGINGAGRMTFVVEKMA
jgi:hypothetical protein